MSTREIAYSLIDSMNEQQLGAFVNFIKSFLSNTDETPNEETIAAMNDVKNGKNLSGPFYSVHELMEDLNADD